MTPTVKFLRVTGCSSPRPVVLAIVDGLLVRWEGRRGWTCQCGWTCRCDEPDGAHCDHARTVVGMLDDRVMGGAQ